jgi:hypothetical protein
LARDDARGRADRDAGGGGRAGGGSPSDRRRLDARRCRRHFIAQAGALAKGARERRVRFLDITLNTPIAPLAIENRNDKLGTRTAAAVVKRCDELGLPALAAAG